jgi:hypothetical protein
MSTLKVINVLNPSAGNIAMVTDILGNTAFGGNVGIGTGGGNISFNGSALVIGTQNALPLQFRTSGTQQMVISSTGNVGIGSATPQQTLDVQGNVNVLNTVIMGSSFLRNRMINGAMQVAQYGTSVAPTVSNFTYAMDRFFCAINSGTSGYTVTQLSQANTGLSGFYNALRYQRNSGQTNTTTMAFGQTIETANCYDLAGQTATLSFWARAGSNFSAASSQITARVATGTGVDQGSSGAYNGTWTGYAQTNTVVTITTSWVRYSIAVPIPAGVNEIQVLFYWAGVGTAGTNDYADFTGIQFEAGPVATAFERRLYGHEVSLCQRYFTSSFPIGTAPSSGASSYLQTSGAAALTTSISASWVQYSVAMRSAPTITFYNSSLNSAGTGLWAYYTNGWVSFTSTSSSINTSLGFCAALGGNFSVGAAASIGGNYTASAEL